MRGNVLPKCTATIPLPSFRRKGHVSDWQEPDRMRPARLFCFMAALLIHPAPAKNRPRVMDDARGGMSGFAHFPTITAILTHI